MCQGGEAAADQRQVRIVLRRQVPEVVAEVPEEGVNAGMGRGGRRFFLIRLRRRLFRLALLSFPHSWTIVLSRHWLGRLANAESGGNDDGK
jgi:hypothetical protein